MKQHGGYKTAYLLKKGDKIWTLDFNEIFDYTCTKVVALKHLIEVHFVRNGEPQTVYFPHYDSKCVMGKFFTTCREIEHTQLS